MFPWILALALAFAPEAAPEREMPPPTEPVVDAADPEDEARDARLDALERDNAALGARLERQATQHETEREEDRERLDELERGNAELRTRLDEQAQARDEAEAAERRGARASLHGYLDSFA